MSLNATPLSLFSLYLLHPDMIQIIALCVKVKLVYDCSIAEGSYHNFYNVVS